MIGLDVVPGEDHHVYDVVGNMRLADVKEVFSATGMDPNEVLIESWKDTDKRWAIIRNGKAIGVFGVSRHDDTTGIPWMLGTKELEKIKKYFVKNCRTYKDYMLKEYEILVNFVDCYNTEAVRWLRWLGAVFDSPQPYGFMGRPFYKFYITRD